MALRVHALQVPIDSGGSEGQNFRELKVDSNYSIIVLMDGL